MSRLFTSMVAMALSQPASVTHRDKIFCHGYGKIEFLR